MAVFLNKIGSKAAFLRLAGGLLLFAALNIIIYIPAIAQNSYENRPISDVIISFEGRDIDIAASEQFKLIVRGALGNKYSAVRIREALQRLYDSEKIISAKVEAIEDAREGLDLRFVIKRKTSAERVKVNVGPAAGEPITEPELLLKLDLLNAGASVSEQALQNNADAIQSYLRERGYFSGEVKFSQERLKTDTQVAVTFDVKPNTQARVEAFEVLVKEFSLQELPKPLKLQKGALYSRKALSEDIEKIRGAMIRKGYLAPRLEDTKVVFDPDTNSVSISLKGERGAKIDVKVDAENEKVGEKTQKKLLPIKREGTIDFSAIREGARRLRNRFQEKGYFFVEVEELCSVKPEFPKDETNPLINGTTDLCIALSGLDLTNKEVAVDYKVTLNRRLKLIGLRIEGTNKLSIPEIVSVLDTQQAASLGFIPQFGYGRGYTSTEILEDDRQRIEALMKELGYRNAKVRVKQGASPDGENLIITFVVKEGIPTRIEGVEFFGNLAFPTPVLNSQLPNLRGKNFSRARMRNGIEKLSAFYAKEGYYDAKISASVVELPKDEDSGEERVKIIYNLEKEGRRVIVNRVLINGNEDTKADSIMKAVTIRPNEVLKANEITQTEQNLYSSDIFRRAEVKIEPAGETPEGDKQVDAIVNLEEQKFIITDFGGGYSTGFGPNGFFLVRHVNLFGRMQQGGARVRWSRLQQLFQFDYLNPRFLKDGKDRFAPLSITAEYQRDSTVTRFFRSAFDRGTFGIVQRLDANGNPIDQFGADAGNPTIRRLSLTAESNRTISKGSRSILFLRYKFEDVELQNIESLLVKELLQFDNNVRISGFGATFVRDTRENCDRKYTLLELISRGEIGDPCRYNASDPTKGSYLTIDYKTSLKQLGGNISFQKFQANYQAYYNLPQLANTVLAGRFTLGLANVFGTRDVLASGQSQELNKTLPISERFFAGGSTSLRGFDFESAGPRVAIFPQGNFFNTNGQQVFLNPFTVPFGGNALAIANLEARIPLTKTIQAVPFYDGGNVFLNAGEIFKPRAKTINDVFKSNLGARWSNTAGFGFRINTPFGGKFAIDYGYLLKAPEFFVPQAAGQPAIYRLKQGQLHFRFTQSF